MHSHALFILASVAAPALADTHTLFAGFLESGDTIVGLEFDDATNTLTLTKNISAPGSAGQAWITLDVRQLEAKELDHMSNWVEILGSINTNLQSRKQNLYVLASDAFQSYSITDDLSLSLQSNVSYPSECIDPFSGFISPSDASPYTVWGASWGTNCSGLGMSVDESGTLQSIIAEAKYTADSAVHGTDLNNENNLLYSADLGGNGVWVHSYDSKTNNVTELQFLAAPSSSAPRHLAVHPNQKWVYVLYQTSNVVGVFSRDTTTGLLTDTNTTYSVIPDGMFPKKTRCWNSRRTPFY